MSKGLCSFVVDGHFCNKPATQTIEDDYFCDKHIKELVRSINRPKPDSKSIEQIMDEVTAWYEDGGQTLSPDEAVPQLNRLLEEAKVAELEKLGNAILTDGSSYDNIKPYVQRRLAELKKDKI